MVFAIALPVLFHPESIEWLSILCTCAFCVYFMMLARLIKAARFESPEILKLIQGITISFFAVLGIQQVCVMGGFTVPLSSCYNGDGRPWTLNSLAAEASHMTLVLSALMFYRSMLQTDSGITFIQDVKAWPWTWGSFLWCLFTTSNASAYILLIFALLPWTGKRWWIWGAATTLTACALLLWSPLGQTTHGIRYRQMITALPSLDGDLLVQAENSSGARLAPTLNGLHAFEWNESEIWTGHGVKADQTGIHDSQPLHKCGKAGAFTMAYNYGWLCAIAFWWAIASAMIIHRESVSVAGAALAWFLLGDYNMQLGWLMMACAFMAKHYLSCNKNIPEHALSLRPA